MTSTTPSPARRSSPNHSRASVPSSPLFDASQRSISGSRGTAPSKRSRTLIAADRAGPPSLPAQRKPAGEQHEDGAGDSVDAHLPSPGSPEPAADASRGPGDAAENEKRRD